MTGYPPDQPVPDKVDLALRLGRARKQVENVRKLVEKAKGKGEPCAAECGFCGSLETCDQVTQLQVFIPAEAILAALDNPFGGEQ